jgi:hypothetical protein
MTYRTADRPTFRPAAKQAWAIDQIVNVGFIKGLVVKEKVATPGDGRPDGYVLWQPASNRWYSFQPHFGLARHDSRDEAAVSF